MRMTVKKYQINKNQLFIKIMLIINWMIKLKIIYIKLK